MASDAPQLSERDLRQWKLLADLRARLVALSPRSAAHPSWQDPTRLLGQFDYLCLLLLALVNPVVKTTRALCAASRLRRVQEEVCTRAVSLGSFSEAQPLAEPAFLEELLSRLSREVQGQGARPTDPREAWALWLARDSSIFRALPRMVWAEYGAGKAGCPNHAVRLHVSFHLWSETPTRVAITPGKVCERKVWREQLEEGATYVGDRYFGQDYKMFARLEAARCHFVLRLRDEAVLQVEEEIPVSAEARAAGVWSDAWVRLGSHERYRTGRWRVITVRKASGTTMRLVTNFRPTVMSAREILALYRQRWQIECFFRWLKCLLGCRHWLAESERGVTIQLYLAMIAGLLLQAVLGRRPNQRLWERVQLYLLGWATAEELMAEVQRAQAKANAKKNRG